MNVRFLLLALLLPASLLQGQTTTPSDAPNPVEHKSPIEKIPTFVPPLSAASIRRPLSPAQKLQLSVYNTINPYPIAGAAFRASMAQAFDAYHGYGQGASGYAKRFGAAYAMNASTQFFGTFFYPVLLRQDPRYFRKDTGTTSDRMTYAITRVFVTRTDSGRSSPNVSFWLAAATSAALSNTYYPPGDRSAGDAAWRFGIAFGSQASFNIAKEFWPNIKRTLIKK
jgi:hypothetical protein